MNARGPILELFKPVLLHERQQALDFHKINTADVTSSAGYLLGFFRHLELEKIARRRREIVEAVGCDDDVVLDADAPPSLEVNARFHC